eukprot:TRINITY_DN115_c2_g1_i1.p1 TRINITY_DN115_c2_g1~~TRINITY_DN115_c2_g1_i1.p1  ORF type:complete len:682 (+),score=157.54 TRINITY_DN115_c2_g1_i1:72-2117(+)
MHHPTFKFENGPHALRDVLESRGWREVIDDSHCLFHWRNGRFKPSDYKEKLFGKRINHMPKSTLITKKDLLQRALRKMKALHGALYGFLPEGYILPNEYTKFIKAFAAEECKEKNIWIVKPSDLSRGRKIFLMRELDDLKYDQQCVIQKYVHPPLLVNGYKMDLRIYVLVTSCQPLRVHLYEEGLVRFATQPYDADTSDLSNAFSHLTNASINKLGEDYKKNKDGIGTGSKWTLRRLKGWCVQQNISWEVAWARIESLVRCTILTLADTTPLCDGCFELLGFDVMFDTKMNAWLIEVNYSPALGIDCDADAAVKIPLLNDMIDVLETETPEWDFNHLKKQVSLLPEELSLPSQNISKFSPTSESEGSSPTDSSYSLPINSSPTASTIPDSSSSIAIDSSTEKSDGESVADLSAELRNTTIKDNLVSKNSRTVMGSSARSTPTKIRRSRLSRPTQHSDTLKPPSRPPMGQSGRERNNSNSNSNNNIVNKNAKRSTVRSTSLSRGSATGSIGATSSVPMVRRKSASRIGGIPRSRPINSRDSTRRRMDSELPASRSQRRLLGDTMGSSTSRSLSKSVSRRNGSVKFSPEDFEEVDYSKKHGSFELLIPFSKDSDASSHRLSDYHLKGDPLKAQSEVKIMIKCIRDELREAIRNEKNRRARTKGMPPTKPRVATTTTTTATKPV